MAFLTASTTSCSLVMSMGMASALPPIASNSLTVAAMFSGFRAARHTVAPSSMNFVPMALPIPEPPPVMNAILSFSLP